MTKPEYTGRERRRYKRYFAPAGAIVLVIALIVMLVGVASAKKRSRWTEEYGKVAPTWTPVAAPVRGIAPDVMRSAIETRLAAERPSGLSDLQWKHVHELYDAYDRLPLWLEAQGPRGRARELVSEIAKAPTHGLSLADYPLAELREALAAVRDSSAQPDAARLATADILLSAAYVTLAEDLLSGQLDPRKESQDWHIDPKVDVDSALAQRLKLEPLDRAIAQLRPQDDNYDMLREQLVTYRELVERGGWNTVPEGKKLRPGDADSLPRLQALVQRLRAEGYLDAETSLTPAPITVDTATGDTVSGRGQALYDPRLGGAVAEFQRRHGIDVDSVLGPATLASINVPATYRLEQIALNLERFRWLPRSFGDRYILVNVPEFKLAAYDSGRKALEMKVIVGAEFEDRRTPVFSDSMQYVVFRPYWNVTDEIANKEIWPKVAKDPTYMERNQLETYQEGGKTRVRQLPGPKNSLGLVKFIFPNDFNIYLHDTPEDRLFEKDVRAFSHGCIRVERPADLAEWVLGWDAGKVNEAMESGKDNRFVGLPKKLPVYIVYLTTYIRGDQLYFGNDLYDRDSGVVSLVADGAMPSAETIRTLGELKRLVAE